MGTDEIDMEAVLFVRSTATRMEIVRQLSDEALQRPTDFLAAVQTRTGTSEGNVYQALGSLTENGLVEKSESETTKATLYSLTALGIEVADFLELGHGELSSGQGDAIESPTTDATADDLVRSGATHNRVPQSDAASSATDETAATDDRTEQIKRQLRRIMDQTDTTPADLARAVDEIRTEEDR